MAKLVVMAPVTSLSGSPAHTTDANRVLVGIGAGTTEMVSIKKPRFLPQIGSTDVKVLEAISKNYETTHQAMLHDFSDTYFRLNIEHC